MRVLNDPDQVARAAANLVTEGMQAGGTLTLAGGTTPALCYRLLADAPIHWGRITILFGDERCVPPDHPDSNYRMARETLLDKVAPATVHRIPAELGPEVAAAAYEWVVEKAGSLDIVLLGMGPDGHCASLFLGNRALDADSLVVGVHGAPKPPPERVSLTLATLRSAGRVLLLVTGEDKAEALARARRGEVPAGMIPGAEWLVDRAAAGGAA
jgi:6-phosphogluconolactonase